MLVTVSIGCNSERTIDIMNGANTTFRLIIIVVVVGQRADSVDPGLQTNTRPQSAHSVGCSRKPRDPRRPQQESCCDTRTLHCSGGCSAGAMVWFVFVDA